LSNKILLMEELRNLNDLFDAPGARSCTTISPTVISTSPKNNWRRARNHRELSAILPDAGSGRGVLHQGNTFDYSAIDDGKSFS